MQTQPMKSLTLRLLFKQEGQSVQHRLENYLESASAGHGPEGWAGQAGGPPLVLSATAWRHGGHAWLHNAVARGKDMGALLRVGPLADA
jgi:hypothetical protein